MRALAIVVLSGALAACSNGTQLTVDLRTDLAPGLEFDAVRTTIGSTAIPYIVAPTDDVAGGVRVAELAVMPGELSVRVELLAGGVTVDERTIEVTLTGSYALTVVVARSCSTVHCPRAGDPMTATTCAGGSCVDPHCSSSGGIGGDMPHCPAPQCATAADCHVAASCEHATCTAGSCFATPDDHLCGPLQRCAGDRGCVVVGAPDGGLHDAGADGGADAGTDAGHDAGACGPCGGVGSRCCGASCTNVDVDDSNCGACGVVCTPPRHCTFDAPTMRTACADCSPTGCAVVPGGTCCPDVVGCVQSMTDHDHCGSCYTRCAATESCSHGACVPVTTT